MAAREESEAVIITVIASGMESGMRETMAQLEELVATLQ